MKIKNTNNDYEFYSIVNHLLQEEIVQGLDNYKQHLFQSRLEHSVAVSYYSYRLGKKLGLNYEAMTRGGLLHDLFLYDRKTTKFDEGTHAWVHPRIALNNARKITEITPLEEDIIVNHMMGSTLDITRSKEAFIVSMVDKYLALSEVSRSLFFTIFKRKEPRRLVTQLNSLNN